MTPDARERRIEELEKEPVITLPEGKNVSLGELVELYEDSRLLLGRLVEALADNLCDCGPSHSMNVEDHREDCLYVKVLPADARRALGARG